MKRTNETKTSFIKYWMKYGLLPEEYEMNRKFGDKKFPAAGKELRTRSVAEMLWKLKCDRLKFERIKDDPKRIADVLEDFNMYRRGKGRYAPKKGNDVSDVKSKYSAKMVGAVIDRAVEMLRGISNGKNVKKGE